MGSLNQRKQELIQAHTWVQEKNEKDLKEFRLENQKKLNNKRSELYAGYTAPDDQPKVEESIIYVHNDDDDGDDDDYNVSTDDDYDVNHNIDDADGGDLPVAESGSLTNKTEVPRSSMEDIKPKDGNYGDDEQESGNEVDEEDGEDAAEDEDDGDDSEMNKKDEDPVENDNETEGDGTDKAEDD